MGVAAPLVRRRVRLPAPVVIGLARGATPLFLQAGAEALPGRWLLVLALYDLTFGLLAYALFDYLVED